MSEPLVLIEYTGQVAVITLNRADAMNALSKAMSAAIIESFKEVQANQSVRAVVLTANGRAFCAGVDLKELGQRGIRAEEMGGDSGLLSVSASFEVPVIGAINGFAITGGFELALMCDILIASENAKFGDTHVRVGVLPGWGLSQKLPRIIGVQRAKEMSLTGNFIDAPRACDWGLVNRVTSPEDLLPTALGLANDIASCPPEAVKEINQLIDFGWNSTLADGMKEESDRAKVFNPKVEPASFEGRREGIRSRGKDQK
jgi:enoyl-CoA hydratase